MFFIVLYYSVNSRSHWLCKNKII